jgi:hypothetical protein
MKTARKPRAAAPTEVPAATWSVANQRHLLASLAFVRAALAAHAGVAGPNGAPAEERERALAEAEAALRAPSSLRRVVAGFGLSDFERDVLLLCAGCELDRSFAALCAAAQRDERRSFATFGLALAALSAPHWSAFTSDRPLRRWRLIEVVPGEHLTSSRLRIDERVLHFLTGVTAAAPELRGLLDPVDLPDRLAPSHLERARRLAAIWQRCGETGEFPAVQLDARDLTSAAAVAATAASALDLRLQVLRAGNVPASAAEREDLARLLEREAVLGRFAVLVDLEPGSSPEVTRAALSLLDLTRCPVVLCGGDPASLRRRPLARMDLPAPDAAEQRRLWQEALGDEAATAEEQVEVVSTHFQLGPAAIRAAGQDARRRRSAEGADLGAALWDACRRQTRPRIDGLAQRIEARARWDDLVLPASQRHTLSTLAAHVRQRSRVYEQWGFAARSDRGLGIGALFTGASGTGKTMAAEVLANELRLDLYRIDLSALVSKWIGETEKHLRQVFDAAEAGGVILLFDEADALFGRRSEVRDSHDRYANIEVGYLLQRVETYRGLVILTTNQPQSLDAAFARRIRFTVQFPFPDAEQRAEIWRRAFPPATPTEALRVEKLARLNLTGGHIRNVALNAAFLAADAREPVRMSHLLAAAHAEFAKLERPLSPAETAGWT